MQSETNSIISIHAASELPTAYDSAMKAAKHAMGKKPELSIVLVDSKAISLDTWFLAEQAAQLSQRGALQLSLSVSRDLTTPS